MKTSRVARFRVRAGLLAVGLGALVAGCGNGQKDGLPQDSLAGTWLVTSSGSSSVEGWLTLSRDFGSVTFERGHTTSVGSVELVGDVGTGIWTYTRSSTNGSGSWRAIIRHEVRSNLNMGQVPFQLGGTWKFSSRNDQDHCTAVVGNGSLSFECNFPTSEIPELGKLSTRVTATRTVAKPSILGDLGGEWKLTAGSATCTATISESTFTTSCLEQGEVEPRTLSVTVDGDTASATSNFGVEFAAIRQR